MRAARADVDLALGMFVGQGSLALGFEGAEGDSAASDADAGSSLALALAVWHPVNNASADAGKREVISVRSPNLLSGPNASRRPA